MFVPLFFVVMGAQVHVGALSGPPTLFFAFVLTVAAIVGKLACAFGVIARGVRRLAVAIAMAHVARRLVFAGIGGMLTLEGRPILSEGLLSAVVLMVLVTTLAAPIGLRWALSDDPGGPWPP